MITKPYKLAASLLLLACTLFFLNACRKDTGTIKAAKSNATDPPLLITAKAWYNELSTLKTVDTGIRLSDYNPKWDQFKIVKNAAGKDVLAVSLLINDFKYVELDVLKSGDAGVGAIKVYTWRKNGRGLIRVYTGNGQLLSTNFYDKNKRAVYKMDGDKNVNHLKILCEDCDDDDPPDGFTWTGTNQLPEVVIQSGGGGGDGGGPIDFDFGNTTIPSGPVSGLDHNGGGTSSVPDKTDREKIITTDRDFTIDETDFLPEEQTIDNPNAANPQTRFVPAQYVYHVTITSGEETGIVQSVVIDPITVHPANITYLSPDGTMATRNIDIKQGAHTFNPEVHSVTVFWSGSATIRITKNPGGTTVRFKDCSYSATIPF